MVLAIGMAFVVVVALAIGFSVVLAVTVALGLRVRSVSVTVSLGCSCRLRLAALHNENASAHSQRNYDCDGDQVLLADAWFDVVHGRSQFFLMVEVRDVLPPSSRSISAAARWDSAKAFRYCDLAVK